MKQMYKRALSIIPALLLHVLWLYALLHWFDHGLLLQKSAINELADSRIRQTLAYIERISQFPYHVSI